MQKFMDWLEEHLLPPLTKLGTQRHLVAVRNGLAVTLPAIIVGSIFLIFGNIPIEAWLNFLAPYQPMLDAAVNASIGIISLLAAVGIGYELSKSYELAPASGAVLSGIAFIITQLSNDYVINVDGFGAGGLFTAIISAIVSVEITRFCVKRNWVIKLPGGVPPAVGDSFVALVPTFLTLILFWLVRVPLNFDINVFIQHIFTPLVFALNSLPGILIYTLIVSLLWCGGIHGDMTLEGVADTIFIQFVVANSQAFANHQALPYITASGFSSLFVNVGGTGATLTLAILMLFSRSKTYKELGKLSLPGALFEINEPIIFGFPIVMNPIIMIPFVVVPQILAASTYLLMSVNLIARPVTMVPWTMPPILGPLMATGWDWRAAVWSALEIVIAVVIYYPFFKMAEKMTLKKELEEEQLELGKKELN
ncbi:MAG: PTS sugar transporter subunit IIC [Hespellia sp.]|nr:PTS sugar transporter subunit IIC [Hespellia sp.]